MADDLASNPFAALFSSLETAKAFTEAVAASGLETETKIVDNKKDSADSDDNETDEDKEINILGEKIFRISLEKDSNVRHVPEASYFPDIAEVYNDHPFITCQNLKHIVFEVLMLDRHEPDFQVSHQLDYEREQLHEASELEHTEVLTYLYCCYRRYLIQKDVYERCKSEEILGFLRESKDVIVLNARMCLQQPALYQFQDFVSQFINLCLEEDLPNQDRNNFPCQFLREVAEEVERNSDQGSLSQSYAPILQELKLRLNSENMSIVHRDAINYVKVMHFFTSTSALARTFLSLNTPEPSQKHHGRIYEMTPIGAALSLSVLPRSENGPFQFFSKPSTQSKKEVDMVEQSVWRATEELIGGLHKIFVDLMTTTSDMKHYTLRWLGLCIQGNSGRGKLWASNLPANLFVSDAFAVNLTHMLLLFCKPFSNPDSPKLLKIQPTYTQAVASGDREMLQRSIHLLGMPKETFLIPGDDVEKEEIDENFTFITECFFMAQKAIQVFLHPVLSRLLSVNRDLHQIQRLYNEVLQQSQGNEEPLVNIKNRMEKAMSFYLTRKAALTQPQLLSLAFNFQIASSAWLCRVATTKLPRVTEVDASSKMPELEFPVTDQVPGAVACIPEFIAENICHLINHIHRFEESVLESEETKIEHLLSFVLVYMSSPQRMKNPHLRAELAEMLSSLMPVHISDSQPDRLLTSQYFREQLFETHPHITFLAEALMHVFVSIEMTGESVAFEQKFNYRRPMYIILKYIWNIPLHQNRVKELADLAEMNITATDPPLFLRFINLLVNDATYLLDEALMFMGQIREKQQERDRGDWSGMPEAQRHQEEANLQQISRLAQYHNVMGSSTISTLRMLTGQIQSIFCHATFVDRMASMLNYFLCRLVGPKQKEFIVKDKENFDFKPQETVSNILAIYLNLQGSELFCKAVFEDQRSYTPELFSQACQVMEKIGESPQTILDFMALDDKIKELKTTKLSEEQALSDAPEEFLDPIMGTLMTDPVMLPSSKNIVDRNVIARHILSDQTDPFNRQPLSLDQVIAQPELKSKIEAWVTERTKHL
ncbi:ubiquitin conjugation factor E4 A [Elysia marginata]|uniref:Ubiquitin conjugation factor E4 A n=1 Tax=Elysia marginata TaxID=1093978 RepID=A0AAV4II80_9GAST|nr:ubiquitin conjugation factor E4 A [Elysia marginata]